MMRVRAFLTDGGCRYDHRLGARPKPRKRSLPPAPPPAPQVALPASANGLTVRYYYERRQYPPIWFGAKGGDAAIAQLMTILRRAPIDGFANGPSIAATVEATVARARASNDPMQMKAAELALSAAWADYVQALKRPSSNVIYGDPALADDRCRTSIARWRWPKPRPRSPSTSPRCRRSILIMPRSATSPSPKPPPMADAPRTRRALNLERARIIPGTGKYILVNSAEQRLHMMEGGQSVGSMKVVVGSKKKYGLPTPIVASTMYYAIANPYWHVPDHLIRKTTAPGVIKGGEAYLKARGYEMISDFSENPQILPASSVDWKGVVAGTSKVLLRQKPNGQNSMGKMKFPFPNKEGIYLHDTPTREYFALADRAMSNGCIRVEDYRRLANWLFGRDVAAVGSAPEQHIAMPRGVPVLCHLSDDGARRRRA